MEHGPECPGIVDGIEGQGYETSWEGNKPLAALHNHGSELVGCKHSSVHVFARKLQMRQISAKGLFRFFAFWVFYSILKFHLAINVVHQGLKLFFSPYITAHMCFHTISNIHLRHHILQVSQ